MLARVAIRGKGLLPKNRGQLVDAFIRDLLGREEYQKHQQFDEPLKVQLLAGLAFQTRQKGQIAFDYVEACVLLQKQADILGSRADIPDFISEVVDNNVLTGARAGLMSFTHEMYQEYLAAVEIENRVTADRSFLLSLQGSEHWEEPLVLFSGITSERTKFIREIAGVNPLIAARALTSAVDSENYLRSEIILAARKTAAEFSEADHAARALVALVELKDFDGLKVVLDKIEKPTKHHRRAIQEAISRANSHQVLDLLASLEHKRNRILLSWAVASTHQCGILERSPPTAGVKLTFLDHLATRSLRDMHAAIEIFRRFGFYEQAHAENLLRACDVAVGQALERVRFTGVDLTTNAIRAAQQLAQEFNLQGVFQPIDRAKRFYGDHKLVGFHPLLTLTGESHVAELVRELASDSDEQVRCFALCVILNRSLEDQFKPSALIRTILSGLVPIERLKRIIKLLARTDELSRYAPLIREQLVGIAASPPLNLETLQSELQEWPGATAPADIDSLFSPRLLTTQGTQNEKPITADESSLSVRDALTQLLAEQVQEHQNRIERIVWRRESIRVGSLFTGKVTNVTETGVSVRVDKDIEGVIRDLNRPPTKYSTEHGIDVGKEVEVEILRVFEHEDIIWMGLSRYQWEPWKQIVLHRRSGALIRGVVRKLVGSGAVIQLDNGLSGFLHVSEAATTFVNDIAKVFRVGDQINVRVIRLDKRSGRINLSSRMLPSR
jgi:predicted RNA-binding protein with RPS1 domain